MTSSYSSCTQKTSSHIDHISCCIGSCNNLDVDSMSSSTLLGLNELSKKNHLILCRRQVSNRDIRILVPSTNSKATSNTTKDLNFEKFLFNFNKLSYACYLTALNAQENLWTEYEVPRQLAKDTSFFVLGSSPTINEKCVKETLQDVEFTRNYINILFNMHNKVSHDLYRVLDTKLPTNEEFLNDSNSNDIHLFRSFRIIGLRHPIRAHNRVGNLSDIVEIRVCFDVKQCELKSTYDCFIECELSYYRIGTSCTQQRSLKKSNSMHLINDYKWLNILNKHLIKRNRLENYSLSSSQSSIDT